MISVSIKIYKVSQIKAKSLYRKKMSKLIRQQIHRSKKTMHNKSLSHQIWTYNLQFKIKWKPRNTCVFYVQTLSNSTKKYSKDRANRPKIWRLRSKYLQIDILTSDWGTKSLSFISKRCKINCLPWGTLTSKIRHLWIATLGISTWTIW